jgi:hypothetical protein
MKINKLWKCWNATIVLVIGGLMVGAAIWSLVTGSITYKFGRPQFASPYTVYRSSEPGKFYKCVGKLSIAGFAIVGFGLLLYKKEG